MRFPTANPLVPVLVAGRPEGYALLYDRLGRSLLRVARVMLNNSAEAEDAVQDVFVELVRHRQRLTQVQDLDAYVFTMLRHAVSRRLKRLQNEKCHLRRLHPVATVERSDHSSDDLAAALASLPTEQREVIALKIDGGLTFAQVGEILNISPNTAASRYRYAMEKLRQSLE